MILFRFDHGNPQILKIMVQTNALATEEDTGRVNKASQAYERMARPEVRGKRPDYCLNQNSQN